MSRVVRGYNFDWPDTVLCTELPAWMRRVGLSAIELGVILGTDEQHVEDMAMGFAPIPNVLIEYLRLLDLVTVKMTEPEKKAFALDEVNENLLEPAEILGLEDGKVLTAETARDMLVQQYEHRSKAMVKRANDALDQIINVR